MPSMANITVKDAANADKVFVSKTASAGDKSPARWSQDAASSIIGRRPTVTVETRDNGAKNGRVYKDTITFPIVSTIGGVETVTWFTSRMETTIPTNVDNAVVNDAYVQMSNLRASALLRSVVQEGYAPT